MTADRPSGELDTAEAEAHLGDAAGRRPDFTGHHMLGYRLTTSQGPALLRLPVPGSAEYDPRMFNEATALRAARAAGCRVPALLYAGDQFLIERFIDGEAPSSESWEQWLDDLLGQVALLQTVTDLPMSDLTTVDDWRAWLLEQLVAAYERFAHLHPDRHALLGIPAPQVWWRPPPHSHQQRLVLLHGDLHPGNLLLAGEEVWILDWELAQLGDPVWEAATSVHRTRWASGADERQVASRWLEAMRQSSGVDDVRGTFDFYRDVELWRSLVNDTQRYPARIASGQSEASIDYYVRSYHAKLVRGSERFGCNPASEADVRARLLGWAAALTTRPPTNDPA